MVRRYSGPFILLVLNARTGEPVDLPPESEEVAGFYAAMIETPHAQDAVFNKNFFDDFLKVLKKSPPVCSPSAVFAILCITKPTLRA